MNIVIYGGDRLGKIPVLLNERGVQLVKHITGRKHGDLKSDIPQQVTAVFVFTDYLSHSMALEVKENAKRRKIKTVFVKRSWSQISRVLDRYSDSV